MIFQDAKRPQPAPAYRPTALDGSGCPDAAETALTGGEPERAIDTTLRQVGPRPDHAYYYPHMLARGKKQRVGLTRALILQPKVIVADEALASLDMSMRLQIINLMFELQAKKESRLFMSHNIWA